MVWPANGRSPPLRRVAWPTVTTASTFACCARCGCVPVTGGVVWRTVMSAATRATARSSCSTCPAPYSTPTRTSRVLRSTAASTWAGQRLGHRSRQLLRHATSSRSSAARVDRCAALHPKTELDLRRRDRLDGHRLGFDAPTRSRRPTSPPRDEDAAGDVDDVEAELPDARPADRPRSTRRARRDRCLAPRDPRARRTERPASPRGRAGCGRDRRSRSVRQRDDPSSRGPEVADVLVLRLEARDQVGRDAARAREPPSCATASPRRTARRARPIWIVRSRVRVEASPATRATGPSSATSAVR